MALQTLETRVENLNRRVTILEQLPRRMDRLVSQCLLTRVMFEQVVSRLDK